MTPKTSPIFRPRVRYHVTFDHSASNGVDIRGEPPKLGCAGARLLRWGGVGVAETLAVHTPVEFGRSRSNGTSVIKEIRLKHLTPRQGHSKSSEPTRIDPPPMIPINVP